jgi:hypothetical protein
MDYRSLASQIAVEEGVDPDLFMRLVEAESSFNPNATSSAGAIGLTQLMPGTASDLGVDPTDPVQNLRGGARYLKQQLDSFGDPTLALAAYNAGPGNVRKYGGIPPFKETQAYIDRILGMGPPMPPQTAQQTAPAQGDFARGFQPAKTLADLYPKPIDPYSLYDPAAIRQRYMLT